MGAVKVPWEVWMKQPNLFDPGAPPGDLDHIPRSHRGDPETSREAARSMADVAPTDREVVLYQFKWIGWLTADEVADRLDWEPYRVRRRVSELKQAGLIRDTGLRRKTASGRNQVVYEAC